MHELNKEQQNPTSIDIIHKFRNSDIYVDVLIDSSLTQYSSPWTEKASQSKDRSIFHWAFMEGKENGSLTYSQTLFGAKKTTKVRLHLSNHEYSQMNIPYILMKFVCFYYCAK